MRKKAIVGTLGIILVILAVAWLVFPSSQLSRLQTVIGKVAFPIGALLVFYKLIQILFSEEVKLVVASVLRTIRRLPLKLKRLVIGNEIEGNLNRAVKEFGREGSGLLPYPVKLVWASPGEIAPDSFFRDGKIIIKLDYSDNPQRNIVEAALLYCKAGLIPKTRRYLWKALTRALDLVFVNAVLERNALADGSVYFTQDILPRELDGKPDVERNYRTLETLHERGYFTRVLLPELRDYAGRVHRADTHSLHKQWITAFINFLSNIAMGPPHKKIVLDHIQERFRVSVIMVGIPQRLAFEGQRPYLKRIAKCAIAGARTVYLVGTARAIPDIAKSAVRLKIADLQKCQSCHTNRNGKIGRRWCARLQISEQTAASALQRIPDIEEWPDLEIMVESDESGSGVAQGQ